MYVKYGTNGEIESFFVGCVPENSDGFVEIPDDDAIVAEYIEKHKQPADIPGETPEERIAALENLLAAYEAAYAKGVAEA